jgi:iron uptake system component EfeO
MQPYSVTQRQDQNTLSINRSFDRGIAVTVLVCAAVVLAGCGRSDSPAPASQASASQQATEVKVALSEAGCEPQPGSIPAGPVRFVITNAGASHVTEVELLRDGKIVGEKEGVKPGLSGDLVLRLEGGGTYSVHCAGGAKNDWPLTVTGGSGQPATGPANATLAAATQGYHDYVVAEVDQLVTSTKQFTDAVRAGDMDKAKQLFPMARVHYESIEPVAESFGDLDPQIDARIDDVSNPADWTGFHRIEKALWQDKSLNGMGPLADKLDADIAALKSKVATETYQPAQLGNGAGELLNEVSTTKVTGEEDRYSHTDLWDFAANVDGARKCFDLLKPALAGKDPALAQQLDARFTEVADNLAKYRQGDGYVDYSTVTQDQRRRLANAVNALAESMSQVAGRVV